MMQLVLDTFQQTFLFLPLIFGIYLTYRILNITDLTVGGSYVVGASIFAKLLTSGFPQTVAFIAGLLSGLLAGFSVFMLQRFAKINALIASILIVFILASVSFAIMAQPNISLLENQTFLNQIQNFGTSIFSCALLLTGLFLLIAIYLLLNSKTGLRLRAYGNNALLLNRLGFRANFYLAGGLMLSNLLAALCGMMAASVNGYADIHMDDGIALTAIGAVVIGCKLMQILFIKSKNFYPGIELVGTVLGSFIYFLILHLLLTFNINPIYLKLCLGLLLAVFLSTAHYACERGRQYETFTSN
jgi:putative ABC transport system permease protein